MKSRISNLSSKSPRAFLSLKSQLAKGSPLKSLAVRMLIELSELNILYRIPFVKDLLFNARGLISGHIADVELIDSLPDNGVASIYRPDLKFPLKDTVMDVIMIGSGPGSVVATEIELASGIQNILVIERGSAPKTPHSLHHSLTHVVQDFYQAGQELILAKGLPLFAQANVVGGGSEVNSGLYHELPNQYLEGYSKAFKVSERNWLNAENSTFEMLKPVQMNVSQDNSVIARGAIASNLTFGNIPRWRTYFDDGSFEHRGMNEIYWNSTYTDSRIRFAVDSEVLKISTKNSEFVEVVCRNTINGEKSVFKARQVHLAAGAISTPILLARSGIIRWRDTRFSWHPMIRVVAKTLDSDLGAGDIDPFQAWTENRKLKFGAAVNTAPLLSIALGRTVGLKEASRLRSFYVSYSSTGKGGLTPFLGLPWYKFSKMDKQLAREGIELLKTLVRSGGGEIIDIEKVSSKKCSTVHIFGTLPISSAIYVQGTNQLKADTRIRVSDASILPFGPGVNPQGVVMTAVRVANFGNSND